MKNTMIVTEEDTFVEGLVKTFVTVVITTIAPFLIMAGMGYAMELFDDIKAKFKKKTKE